MRAEKRILRTAALIVALAFVISAFTAPAFAAKKPWEKIKFPELGDVHVPDYERHVLDNGLTIYLLEDHEWPLVEGQALVHTGGAYEPADKVGLASVTGEVLRSGGTKTIPADELDEQLERMGAQIESGIGDTSGFLRFSFLSKDSDRGLDLVADVLRNPAFDEDKIDVALTGQRAGISRRNDNLNGIVAREIQRAVWGDEHPYARNTEYATLDNISRDDITAFYDYFYHPNNIMLAVWGDFDPQAMLASLKERFGDWPGVENPIPELPNEPMETQRRRVLVADKEDVNQGRFAVGQVGMRADDPDYYAMSVANRILGGGFGDRLFNEVRSRQGLAYNVGSSAGIDFERPGTWQAYCGTKSESTDKALGAVLAEVEKMREAPVTRKELTDAKEAILNSNVFNYVSPSQVLTRKMGLDYLGYPSDFLETYNEKIRAVGAAEVEDVMQRRVDPDEFAIVAVGKTGDWDGDLSSYGPVEELDISIPEPEGPEFPEATAESIEKGRAILSAGLDAHGGRALSNLHSVHREEAMTLSMGGMELAASMVQDIVYPDRLRVAVQLPFGEMTQVVDGDQTWSKSPQGIQDVTGDDARHMHNEILEDPFYLLGNFDRFQLQELQAEAVGETSANVVLVWIDDDDWVKLYFDPKSHLLLKSQSKGKHPMTGAPGIQDVIFGPTRSFGGVQVPESSRILHDGEQIMSFEMKKFEVNPKVDEAIFTKPSS